MLFQFVVSIVVDVAGVTDLASMRGFLYIMDFLSNDRLLDFRH